MRCFHPLYLSILSCLLIACGETTSPEVAATVNTSASESIVSVTQAGGDTTARTLAVDIQEIDLPERYYLVFRQELDLRDMNGFLAMESDALSEAFATAGLTPTGPTTALFYAWDTDRGWGDAAVALPVDADTRLLPYARISLPARLALMLEMRGSYERLSVMHYALNEALQSRGYQPVPPSIEEYIVGPADGKSPEEFITRIYYPYEIPASE